MTDSQTGVLEQERARQQAHADAGRPDPAAESAREIGAKLKAPATQPLTILDLLGARR